MENLSLEKILGILVVSEEKVLEILMFHQKEGTARLKSIQMLFSWNNHKLTGQNPYLTIQAIFLKSQI
jgi:hypothetical protein